MAMACSTIDKAMTSEPVQFRKSAAKGIAYINAYENMLADRAFTRWNYCRFTLRVSVSKKMNEFTPAQPVISPILYWSLMLPAIGWRLVSL